MSFSVREPLFEELNKTLKRMEARLTSRMTAVVQEQSHKPPGFDLDELAEKLVHKLVPLLKKELVTVRTSKSKGC